MAAKSEGEGANMTRAIRLLLAFALVAMLGFVRIAYAEDLGSLDGVWEGDLAFVDPPDSISEAKWRFRLEIHGNKAKVITIPSEESSGKPHEVKPGKFIVAQYGPSGVVLALDAGHDNEGTWVETWNFTVTKKDKNTLITRWCRMVNNIDLPLSVSHSKFALIAAGEMARVVGKGI
jgi:hypothetical protein